MSTTPNFYNNIITLKQNGLISDEQIVNALTRGFITNEQYIELMGSEEIALDGVKTAKIVLSKTMLEDFLKNNPYVDQATGKKYAVTFEKQSLLANEIATYQLSTSAGIPYEIKWNTTGEECVVFTIEQITALALAISAYVKPLVSYQQSKEVAVKNAHTVEEVAAIEIDYSKVVY